MSAATLAPAHRVRVPARPAQTAVLVARTLRDRWRSLLGWGLGLVGVCVLQLAVYPSVQSSGQQSPSQHWSSASAQSDPRHSVPVPRPSPSGSKQLLLMYAPSQPTRPPMTMSIKVRRCDTVLLSSIRSF